MSGARPLGLALLALLPAAAAAREPADAFSEAFKGSFRSLLSDSRSVASGEAFADGLNRLRLSFDGAWTDDLRLHLDWDNEAHLGNGVAEPDFDAVRRRQAGAYFDWLHVWASDRRFYWDTSVYRGYVDATAGPVELTAGRQRIAWGTARFWSPADVFNPVSPLQIEADERQGVDAALVKADLPGGLRWSAVWAPQRGAGLSTAAMRLAATAGGFDWAAFAGRFGRDWTVGATSDGQWGGAGLRGELTYTSRGAAGRPDAFRLAVGSDYQVTARWYLIGEYFRNQARPAAGGTGGEPGSAALFQIGTEILTRDRDFVSAGVRYELTPLIHLEADASLDADHAGAAFLPSLAWNVSSNSDLQLGAELFASAPAGDFHGAPNLFYAQFTEHF